MNKRLILRLPPKTSRAVYIQIILVMVMFWLRDFLHFPSAITYLTDVLTIWIIVSHFSRIKASISQAGAKTQSNIVLMIMFCMLFGAMINFVNPLLTLWGVRNNLRFFVFFFSCIGVLNVRDIDSIINLMKKFFWLNVAMCTFQYFVLDLSNDYLGGFFGTAQGGNAYINVLLCIICSIVMAQYFTEKLKLYKVIMYLISSIYIATLAELKIFYIEFIIILIVAIISARPSLKTIMICLLGIVAINVAIELLLRYNPESLNLLFDSSARKFYLSGNGYTNSGDLNRFTAIQQLYDNFFKGDLSLSLFGFGLGSCEYAKFSFLQSEFYKQYNYLHYRWFTHAWVYLEQGAVGLILLVFFIISLWIFALKNMNSIRKDLIYLALYFFPTCLLGMIYNCALEIEACYLIAFISAVPFILAKYEKGDNYYKNQRSY